MLNQYQYYSLSSMATLMIVSMLSLCTMSVIIARTSISQTLQCSDQLAVYTIQVNNTGAASLFQIRAALNYTNTLPAVVAVFTNASQLPYFNNYNLFNNYNIDIDSVLLAKSTQTLYYQSIPHQTHFYILIRRLTYTQYPYYTNTDRHIQLYTGYSTTYQLNYCTSPIIYNLQVLQHDYSLFNHNTVIPAPLYNYQCKFGTINSRFECQCNPGTGMALCDTYFVQITDFGTKIKKYGLKDTRSYFYYQSKLNSGDQILSIKLKGLNTLDYTYNNTQNYPQYQILWKTQPISNSLTTANIFNQADPAALDGLILKAGHRLLITVYKPEWAHEQQYQIQVNRKSTNAFDVLIKALLIGGSIALFIVLVITIALWYYRKISRIRHIQRSADILQTGIVPHNRVFNAYFNIEQSFPVVNFKQFNDILNTLKGYQENNSQAGSNICSICLDPFEQPQQQNIRITYCCHIFHSVCLQSWMKKQTSCPNCRTDFTKQQLSAIQQQTDIHCMNLSAIDRYIKIWKYVKKIQNTNNNNNNNIDTSIPNYQWGTCHNLQIGTNNDIK